MPLCLALYCLLNDGQLTQAELMALSAQDWAAVNSALLDLKHCGLVWAHEGPDGWVWGQLDRAVHPRSKPYPLHGQRGE
jgi:hypothetical protein